MHTQTFHASPRNAPLLTHTLPVLLYEDDGQVCAHAVELDLMAHGATDAEALEALQGVVLGQYAAARYYGDPNVVPCPAPQEFQDRYAIARSRVLRRLPPEADRSGSIPLPSEAAIVDYSAGLEPCPEP